MAVPTAALDVVTSVVDGLDEVTLYDVEFTGGMLRVTLDRPGGVDLDHLAVANRRLSHALDEADPIPGAYTLEVTSPGLERTLRTAAHWASAVGERVKVKLAGHVEGERRIEGTVTGVEGETAAVLTEAGETITVSIDQVDRARTVFEWAGQPKPGQPKPAGAKPGQPSRTR
jgi:ribosome maturation factor RimP